MAVLNDLPFYNDTLDETIRLSIIIWTIITWADKNVYSYDTINYVNFYHWGSQKFV